MPSVQRAARKSRSTSLDRKLRIEEIEAAFLTIRDLLADEVSEGVDARRLAVGVAGAPR